MNSANNICGLILAGGQGRRMGGVDKGLQPLRGRPMVEWVIERLLPQVGELIINANQNIDAYARYGYPIASDEITEHGGAGPLAGLHAGLGRCTKPYLISVPCDSPFLPLDLVSRLQTALEREHKQISVARTGSQTHPVFALMRSDVRNHLGVFLAQGGRKIDAWYASLSTVEVDFEDEANAFSNINTRDELREHEAKP
ncbi:MAG: molybdenum cofactor guanylyltransferase MobA [Burkholderiales bacterium]